MQNDILANLSDVTLSPAAAPLLLPFADNSNSSECCLKRCRMLERKPLIENLRKKVHGLAVAGCDTVSTSDWIGTPDCGSGKLAVDIKSLRVVDDTRQEDGRARTMWRVEDFDGLGVLDVIELPLRTCLFGVEDFK